MSKISTLFPYLSFHLAEPDTIFSSNPADTTLPPIEAITGVLVFAVIFYMYVSNMPAEVIEETNETETGVVVEEEISETEDLENVEYTDFSVYTSEKKEVKLSDFKDKAVMILFFNPNDQDSMEVLDKVELMYSDYEDKIEFFMINTAEEIRTSLDDKYTIEIYYDLYKDASEKYNITKLPSMIYIDSSNTVFNAKTGFTTTDALEANLDILSENI